MLYLIESFTILRICETLDVSQLSHKFVSSLYFLITAVVSSLCETGSEDKNYAGRQRYSNNLSFSISNGLPSVK